MEIICAGELGGVNREISEIFVDGFGHWLTWFSRDKQKLAAAFEHMFVPEVFYVARIGGDVAGIAACTDAGTSSVKLNAKELRRHLGRIKGTFAGMVLTREFEKPPMKTGDRIASVEFVATAARYRGKGVATAILEHFFSLPQYGEYVLEVADTNTNAVKLYEKLGYREFHRILQKNSKRSGVNALIYMSCVKPAEGLGGGRSC